MLLAYAAYYNWDYIQVDITTAFLHAVLDETIYINYQDSDGNTKYARLKKSLYGLKQAPREWHLQVVERLESIGFKKAKGDSCLWIKKEKGRPVVFILVHVDDFLILYKKEIWRNMVV